jgi:hypothetical protein
MTLTECRPDPVTVIISLIYRPHAHTQLNTYIYIYILLLLFIKSLLRVTRILHRPHGELLSLAQNHLLNVMLLHWLLSK